MPGGKLYKYARRRTTKNKSSKPLSKQVQENRTTLKKLTKSIEHKYYYNYWVSAALDSGAPLVYSLTSLAEGDTSLTREGLKIKPEWIEGYINFRKNVDSVFEAVRFLIVIDKQQEGDTSPTMADVLTTQSTYDLGLRSRVEPNRFTILMDRNIVLDNNRPYVRLNIKKTLAKNLQTYYNGSTVNDIQKNGIYIMITGYNAVTYGNTSGEVRLRFSDL